VAIPLIVITPDSRFGDLLRRNLEDGMRFTFHIMEKVEDAENRLRKLECTLAFLDASASDNDVLQAGRLLRRINPQMRFIIVSGTGWHAPLEELQPIGYISKPFYLPDLMGMMDKLFPPATKEKTVRAALTESQSAPATNTEIPWLSDVARAAQHLTRLTLESSAQAALITRNDELWAYAGQLPQSATRELAETVARYRDRRGESDLLRFIRLASTNADHMLYATRLAGNMVLALIFDAETPFGTIRSQASNLVRSLSARPTGESNVSNDLSASTAETDSEPVLSFADILTDVPPPNPPRDPAPVFDKTADLSAVARVGESAAVSRETSPAVRIEAGTLEYDQEEEEPLIDARSVRAKKLPKKEEDSEADKILDTRPRSITEVARKIVLEPVSPSVYNLTYACLLVPRFTAHLLVGDLADRLAEWIPQICVAFGWRLEHISVHPDYLQWIVNVPPVTSPGYLMRILRQHTSEKIFAEFPRFDRENPSGDFWAPGYLIMGGTQSPPAQLIKEFIQQTRQRQGISQQLSK
jgi:REP element-mobilizing transposase RayT/ActR/RegA family two-component response regulator